MSEIFRRRKPHIAKWGRDWAYFWSKWECRHGGGPLAFTWMDYLFVESQVIRELTKDCDS